MAKVEIQGTNGQAQAQTTAEGELRVISAAYPPFVEQKVRPFRQYFTVDGTADGDNDMGIDGSVTPVDFFIEADPENDRYITSLNFIVGYGTSGQPYQWADGAGLTNGSYIHYFNRNGEVPIHEGVKTNQDMSRLSFSPVTSAWQVRGVGSNNDYGYFISMDLTKMGLPFGVKLDAGSNQRMCVRIRDNAGADADIFNVISYGFERFE